MNDFTEQKCMLCNAKGLQFVNALRDDDTHFAVECPSCGHVQISLLPTVAEDNEYYQSNEMARRLVPKAQMNDEQLMMKYEIWAEKQCTLITDRFPDKKLKILEIGAGYGWFVTKMQKQGYSIDGIELSDEKRQMAKKQFDISLLPYNLLEDSLPLEMQETYDVICMFHVMEHIIDPLFFMKQLLQALKPGGKIVVNVPNYFDHLKKISEPYKNFSYFRPHLSYFKPQTLHQLFEKAGMVDILIEGTQLYCLENAIHWMRTGVPFMERSQIEMPSGLEWIDELYKDKLKKDLVSDGLIAIATKSEKKI
jgi:2-polyprenyl-3-methyl-5-hydroxy-6-metoxy-1,4-benzoquinol methylase